MLDTFRRTAGCSRGQTQRATDLTQGPSASSTRVTGAWAPAYSAIERSRTSARYRPQRTRKDGRRVSSRRQSRHRKRTIGTGASTSPDSSRTSRFHRIGQGRTRQVGLTQEGRGTRPAATSLRYSLTSGGSSPSLQVAGCWSLTTQLATATWREQGPGPLLPPSFWGSGQVRWPSPLSSTPPVPATQIKR